MSFFHRGIPQEHFMGPVDPSAQPPGGGLGRGLGRGLRDAISGGFDAGANLITKVQDADLSRILGPRTPAPPVAAAASNPNPSGVAQPASAQPDQNALASLAIANFIAALAPVGGQQQAAQAVIPPAAPVAPAAPPAPAAPQAPTIVVQPPGTAPPQTPIQQQLLPQMQPGRIV